MENFTAFLKRKNIVLSARRYGIDALGAMAQGLFCSLLIGTIIKTLGEQTGLSFLVDVGDHASAMSGAAMAVAIGYALQAPPLVLFSLATVGYACNALGKAGGPLAVLFVAIIAAECGKAVSKETKVDILVTPLVTILAGVGLAALLAPAGLVDPVPEGLIDAASAVSGCGPAFCALFLEALADGGVACGLPRTKALAYAAQTMAGTAQLMLQNGTHPGVLKDAVCSPGGSTIQGVRALERTGVRSAAFEAVIAAFEKTKELGKQ